MTRRLPPSVHVLSVDGYIARATAHLPRAERLDAAAELRTHLMERVAEHQAQGFSREEAEYLAVRGMGEPPGAGAALWQRRGRAAGWLTLGALLLGGLGWLAWREWLPPPEGVRYEAATPQDIARLFADQDAPRGSYQAATLTYPAGTKSIVYVTVASPEVRNGNEDLAVFTKSVAEQETQNFAGRVPGSYRFQERWLIAPWPMTCDGAARVGLYAHARSLPSPFENSAARMVTGLGRVVGECNNPSLKVPTVTERLNSTPPSTVKRTLPVFGTGELRAGPGEPLRLNGWTVLRRLVVDPADDGRSFGATPAGGFSGRARGLYVAVLPLDRVASASDGYQYGAGRLGLSGDDQPLPPLPPTVPPR